MDTAIYYDGKTSREHPVSLQQQMGDLVIYFLETDQSPIFFPISAINVKNKMAGNHYTFSLDKDPRGPVLEWKGDAAEKFAIEQLNKKNRLGYLEYLFTHKGSWKYILGAVAIIGLFAFAYLTYAQPFLTRKAVESIPISTEIAMAKGTHDRIVEYFEVDEKKSKLLQEFYDQLDFKSDYPIKLSYINSGEINAFATPGGRIYFFSELIDDTEDWRELAAVMSHELVHINKRHGLESVVSQAGLKMLLTAITGADVTGGVSLGNNVLNLSYSRKYEKEADDIGSQYLVQVGISPSHMADFFKTMEEEEGDLMKGSKVVKYISTHPLTSDRIEDIMSNPSSRQADKVHKNQDRLEELWLELRTKDKVDPVQIEDLDSDIDLENVERYQEELEDKEEAWF